MRRMLKCHRSVRVTANDCNVVSLKGKLWLGRNGFTTCKIFIFYCNIQSYMYIVLNNIENFIIDKFDIFFTNDNK